MVPCLCKASELKPALFRSALSRSLTSFLARSIPMSKPCPNAKRKPVARTSDMFSSASLTGPTHRTRDPQKLLQGFGDRCDSKLGPLVVLPVVLKPIKASQSHDPCLSLTFIQRKRHVKRHPVPDEVEAINQIGVPTQFPCSALPSSEESPAAAAAMPASPSRETSAST